MSTIPASDIVDIIPGVISAGGDGLTLSGVMLTTSWRVPTGVLMSFPMAGGAEPAIAVSKFFGPTSQEYAAATRYGLGFTGAIQLPGTLWIAQYTPSNVPAWLKSGQVSTLTIPQLKGITGTLAVTVDGYARTVASLDLSAGTSYGTIAGIIQTALNATPVVGGVSAATGGSTVPESCTMTGQISGNVLTVTTAPVTLLRPGAIVTVGAAVGTQVTCQLTGTQGGVGTYGVSIYQNVPAGTALTATYGLMTLTGPNQSGTFSPGQTLSGTGVTASTMLWEQVSGSPVGGPGTYVVSPSQTFTNETVTGDATGVAVTYDSVSGSFVITSGVHGSESTIGFVSGSAAAALLLTQATGATISQGSDGMTPGAFMDTIAGAYQNWATFFVLQDPDDANGNAQKLAFAAWTSAQLDRFGYIARDSDVTATSGLSTTSLGYLVNTFFEYEGVSVWYDSQTQYFDAFISGAIACINFEAIEGRTTFKFRSQPGLFADVTSLTVANNLRSNSYNFYGVWATGADEFTQTAEGIVSGQFVWLDSFINQIALNNALQLAWMVFLRSMNSVPYNTQGYSAAKMALRTTINQFVAFGAIRAGITLSSTQVIEVNTLAGLTIDGTITQQGWYLQIQPATPQIRAARLSPVSYFFYCDGQSIHKLTLGSEEIQ